MQVLIIEDEARAANQLQNLLKACDFKYTLLGILDSVEDSVQWFQNHHAPELVFMDIQLADGLSFEIFQKVQLKCPIIFTTAFDQYAIRAFKVNSVDYLLKPIQENDLRQALGKFKDAQNQQQFDPKLLKNLLADMQSSPHRQGILVKIGDGYGQVRVADLIYVYSEDSITFGVAHENRVIIEETLDDFYKTLDTTEFFRINRGQIVAKKGIQKIDKYFNHRLKLDLPEARGYDFIVSRQKVNDFKAWMNQ